jgi:chromosome segregation ATPase
VCRAFCDLAEASTNVLRQQLTHAQQQLQQQQLVLSERAAEVGVLRSELEESRARASTVAAASSSAQSDFKVALARSNKLYSQEVRHLQGLLQVGGLNESSCCCSGITAVTVTVLQTP